MTITVTPNPSFSPPRNQIDISVPGGSTISAVALYRVQSGAKTLVRQQPSAGFNAVTVYDYECPYGAPVTYEADVTYVTPGAALFTETWSGFTARWSGDTTHFTASAGVLTSNVGGFSHLSAVLAVGAVLTIASLTGDMTLSISAAGTFLLSPAAGGFTASYSPPGGGTIVDFIPTQPGGGITIVYGASTTVINGVTLPYALAQPSQVSCNTSGSSIGTMTMLAAGTTTPVVYTSSSVTLTAASGWLIHPAVPALSVPISITDRTLPGVNDISPITNASTATIHEVLGQSVPIVSTSGPRLSDALTLTVAARTIAHETALNALLLDQTPLLIRFPNPELGWKDGFYSVGDVARARFAQNTRVNRRLFPLPLRMVQSPVVTQQNAGWSWNAVASRFTSWNQLRQAYNTWADAAVDNRNPGY